MKRFLVLFSTLTAVFAAPQFGGYGSGPAKGGYENIGSTGLGPRSDCQTRIKCQPTLTSANVWDFTCENTNPCVIQREDVLWIKGAQERQQLNVVVPNYKIEEIIKAAYKQLESGGNFVNILLKRPLVSVDAESQQQLAPELPPEVSIEYEPVPPPEKIHYPVDRPYRPLSGPIIEPGGGRY